MSSKKISSKYLRYQSPSKSPQHIFHGSQQTISSKNAEAKLLQKITKLKSALKATQAHNQQLHAKLKYYKALKNQQVPYLQQQIRMCKKKIQQMQKEHIQQITKLKIKAYGENQISLTKFASQNKCRQLQIQSKTKDMKIVQLQGTIKDLNNIISQRQEQMKKMQVKLGKYKLQDQKQQLKKYQTIQDQLHTKVAQSFQHNKQILRLKQSLKDSLKKLQKANQKTYQQTQKIKLLQEQIKQSRKFADNLQRQSINVRQSSDKSKTELLQKIQQIRKLQKNIIEYQYNYKRLAEKHNQISQQHKKLQQQFKALLTQYQTISSKYQEVITNQYDLQRDFEKELHTIIKQLTRRHIVSKSMIMSSTGGSRIFISPGKDQESKNHHQTN